MVIDPASHIKTSFREADELRFNSWNSCDQLVFNRVNCYTDECQLIRYDVIDGSLILFGGKNTSASCPGLPAGFHVAEAFVAPGGEDPIVLLVYSEKRYGQCQNLIWMGSADEIRWAAKLPEGSGTDSFVSMDVHNRCLIANTWSGYRVQVDWESGRSENRSFTK